MLILIREKRTPSSLHYILKDLNSGNEREWTPSKSLPASKVEEALACVATNFAKEIENQVGEPQNIGSGVDSGSSSKGLTFQQFGEDFMLRKSVDIAEYTRSNWQGCLNSRLYPWFGKMLIQDITSAQIEDFFTSLKVEGLKHSTVLKYYTVVKAIFKSASNRNDIPNPMNKVERPRPRKDEVVDEEPQAYPPEEIRHILDCLQKEPTKWQVFILLLADTGIRRGECCALTWEDFDFLENTVSIQGGAGYTKDKGVYLTTTKNRRKRTLDVDPDVLMYVRFLYLETLASKQGISQYLFPHRDDPSKPMLPCTATSYFAKFGKKYGIENMNPHKLRHSYASLAITNGADIASVSEVLGHSDKAFTLRQYTSANKESMRKASRIRRKAVKEYITSETNTQPEQYKISGF